jgi:hypothetical protein
MPRLNASSSALLKEAIDSGITSPSELANLMANASAAAGTDAPAASGGSATDDPGEVFTAHRERPGQPAATPHAGISIGPHGDAMSTEDDNGEHAKQDPPEEKDSMKLNRLATAAVVTTAAIATPPVSSTSFPDGPPIPDAVMKFVGEDKALLAYKAVADGKGGRTITVVLRHPREPAPNGGAFYEDRKGYSCELLLLQEQETTVRVTGRSRNAVDCRNNQRNLRATHLQLTEHLDLSPMKVSFRNEIDPLGTYINSFEFVDGSWRLSNATYVYTDFDEGSDEVLVVKETGSYPENFGMIPIDKFDPDEIQDALSKNRSLVP